MTAYSADPKAEHLLRLSDEVGRIAGTLARMSAEAETDAPVDIETPIDPDFIMSVVRARRMRAQFFAAELFADPAWDMMLDLFHGELTHRRVTVSTLAASAAVPATTALRWIDNLVKYDICARRNDPLDGRRVFVELTPTAKTTLQRYFAKLNATIVI